MTTSVVSALAASAEEPSRSDICNLRSRRLMVTGAASGIGLAVCQAAVAQGAQVTAIVRSLTRAEAVSDVVGRDHVVEADLATPDGPGIAVSRSVDILGGLDCLLAAAGILVVKPFQDTALQEMQDVLAINVAANYALLQKALNVMGAGSSVVMISSTNEVAGHARGSAYSMSKAAIGGLVRSLALEFAGRGIRINSVAPGPTMTKMTLPARSDPERLATILRNVPMGRFGTPEEMANAALFLLSPAASYITGQTLFVDGGYTAG